MMIEVKSGDPDFMRRAKFFNILPYGFPVDDDTTRTAGEPSAAGTDADTTWRPGPSPQDWISLPIMRVLRDISCMYLAATDEKRKLVGALAK